MNSPATSPPLHVHALVALCVLDHLALSGARLAVVEQAIRLGASSLDAGLVLAPFALASTLGALPLGRWVDRVGARRPALAGIAAMALALAACAWSPLPAVMSAAAAVIGLGYTASLVALQSELARDRDARTRAAGFSGLAVGTAASGGLGPFLAGQCLAHGGAPFAFGVLAAIALAAWSGGAWQAARLSAASRDTVAGRQSLPTRQALHGLGGLRRLLLADLLMAFAWNANGFVVPLIAHRHGWPADVAGDLLGGFGAAVLLVRTLPHAWRAHGSDWSAITRALLASGAVLALLAFVSSLPAQFVLEAILGCALGGALPSVMALVEAGTPAGRRAEVLGLRQAVLGLGATATPALLGALVWAAGLAAALAGLGSVVLGAGAKVAPRVRQALS